VVGESIGFALDGFLLFSFSKAQDWIARSRSSPAGKLAVWCCVGRRWTPRAKGRGEVRWGWEAFWKQELTATRHERLQVRVGGRRRGPVPRGHTRRGTSVTWAWRRAGSRESRRP